MTPDSNLVALRSSLPWIFLGWLALAASIALWVLAPESEPGALLVTRTAIGALGSGMMLMGLLLLARGRIAERHSGWLAVAFLAWLVEFALRLSEVLTPLLDGVGLRWLSASASCAALGPGVVWLWDRRVPAGQRELWTRSTRLFCVQLCAALSLSLAGFTHEIGALEAYHRILSWLSVVPGHALTWLVFAGPFAYLFLALRRTARCIERRTRVTELSHAPPVRQ